MASSSASSVQKIFKNDVFLSFRGEDTRYNFVGYLYEALDKEGIKTYKDDVKIEKGEKIDEQLIRSIKESRSYIIVFSKNYANSSWCLNELVEIMECKKTGEQEHTVYPVFFEVEPTDVRHQTGAFGDAFKKHVNNESEEKWKTALKEACGLAGWHLKTDEPQVDFIQKLVEDVSEKIHFIKMNIDEKLVGMETRVKNVIQSLQIDSEDDVRMIGIKGMGGAGKTTLARAVYDRISNKFEGKSFVENVRERSNGDGLKDLQKQILSSVLKDQSIVVTGVFDGKDMMKRRMPNTKALIVLDDVDDLGQLEALAGSPDWFKPGSRIIITTRDEHVLVAHQLNFIHDVSLLSDEEAICLFSRHAFGGDIPVKGFGDLSRQVVHYAAGLPLTIKILGRHLCKKSELEWEDDLEKLKTIPDRETLKILELSYNGLENDQKEIFLDVACILKGEYKKTAIRILESCGLHAKSGLKVLEQKSLITISSYYRLHMHDRLEEMGMNIVRRLHPNDPSKQKEPSKHSRLWIKEEIEDILLNKSGTEETRSIQLKNTNLNATIIMDGLENMRELRYLHVESEDGGYQPNVVSRCLAHTLRFINWFRNMRELRYLHVESEDGGYQHNVVSRLAHTLRFINWFRNMRELRFFQVLSEYRESQTDVVSQCLLPNTLRYIDQLV